MSVLPQQGNWESSVVVHGHNLTDTVAEAVALIVVPVILVTKSHSVCVCLCVTSLNGVDLVL